MNEGFPALLQELTDACLRLDNLNIRFSFDDKELLSLGKNIIYKDN